MLDSLSATTAIVMAGGKGRRLGGYLPKCLFPLPSGQTLLTRVLEQLGEAGIASVLICCSTENVGTIGSFLDLYRAQLQTAQPIEAVPCARCEDGPLPALSEMLARADSGPALVCLADIFFAENPFTSLPAQLAGESAVLISGDTTDLATNAGTGWLTCHGHDVTAVSYRPPSSASEGNLRRWSGSFLLPETWRADLTDRCTRFAARPFEDWIADCMTRGLSCTASDGGTFVNVNSFAEYQSLIALQQESIPQ